MTLGVKLLQSTPSPPSKIIASILEQKTQASADDHKRRNPSMPQALNGPDKLKWLDSKKKEYKRLEDWNGNRTTAITGVKPLHIRPIFKIKDDSFSR